MAAAEEEKENDTDEVEQVCELLHANAIVRLLPCLAMRMGHRLCMSSHGRHLAQVLEPYFMNLDNTWNKLKTLCEYIDDTEVCPRPAGRFVLARIVQRAHCRVCARHQDYLKLDIDTKRNEFIEWRLIIIMLTFVILLFASVTNIFGMNLGLQAAYRQDHLIFVLVGCFQLLL